jgi:predicted secreted protein
MKTLKGQNFRVCVVREDDDPSDPRAIAFATNCTITLTGNTQDVSTKDDSDLSSRPNIISKAWSVQVDALQVNDMAYFLEAIQDGKQFEVGWDEMEDFQAHTNFGCVGYAFLNDATFNFNDRENSATNIQFTGCSAIRKVASNDAFGVTQTIASLTKGQFVRLFLSNNNSLTPAKVIAAAKQLSLHVSVTLESITTKDTTGDWDIQEPVGISYDITTQALIRSNETITSTVLAQGLGDLETIYMDSNPVKWQIANVSGDNNRTKGTVIVGGSCVITQLQMNGPNRQSATYQATLQGYGPYELGS